MCNLGLQLKFSESFEVFYDEKYFKDITTSDFIGCARYGES